MNKEKIINYAKIRNTSIILFSNWSFPCVTQHPSHTTCSAVHGGCLVCGWLLTCPVWRDRDTITYNQAQYDAYPSGSKLVGLGITLSFLTHEKNKIKK